AQKKFGKALEDALTGKQRDQREKIYSDRDKAQRQYADQLVGDKLRNARDKLRDAKSFADITGDIRPEKEVADEFGKAWDAARIYASDEALGDALGKLKAGYDKVLSDRDRKALKGP